MKTLRIGKIRTTAIFLFAFLCLASTASAVPAEEGNFVTLGQAIEEGVGVKDEMIDLLSQPDVPDVMGGQIKSGTVVRVLQKTVLGTENVYYQVSTFGRGGGMIGWVRENYIYEILTEPPKE